MEYPCLVVGDIVDPGRYPKLLIHGPIELGIERKQFRRVAEGVASLRTEQIGVRPCGKTEAQCGIERVGYCVTNIAVDAPARDTRKLDAFGHGLC